MIDRQPLTLLRGVGLAVIAVLALGSCAEEVGRAGASTEDILDRIYAGGGVILLHYHGRGTLEALRKLDLQTG